NLCETRDPIRDETRMLDHVRRMTDHSGNGDLGLRQFYCLPHAPFVLMADMACLDRVGLRANGEHEVDDVGERDVSRVRPVPAAPTDVVTNAIFGQSTKRVIERINTHPAK